MLVVINVLSWQNYVCHDKYFVVTNVMFLTTTLLSWQACFCHDKTCLLSWRTHVCCDSNDTCAAPANDTERQQRQAGRWHSHYCCRTCCPYSWRHQCKQLGTKGQHSQSHFHDCQTSVFIRLDQKFSEKRGLFKTKLVPFDKASDAVLLLVPFKCDCTDEPTM